MSANGQSVFDIITSGWKRKVTEHGSSNTNYVALPNEIIEDLDIEKGDEVAIRESDVQEEHDVELYFDTDE